MPARFGPVIGTRALQSLRTGGPVTVEVEKPKRQPNGDWRCRVRIRGLGRAWIGQAFGVDSLQALQLIFPTLRQHTASFAAQLAWNNVAGDLGFYRLVPDIFDPPANRRIHRAVDRAIRAETAALLRARRRRRGAAAA